MIYYPLQTLVDAGIKEILIVCGPEHSGAFLNLLRSGKEFGVSISYEVQDEPLGIAHGISLAKDFVDGDKFVAILGDNLFEDNIRDEVKRFARSGEGAHLFLKLIDDPKRFGVAEVRGNKVISIVEKPKQPKSNLAVTGVYLYDATAFDKIRKLKPSPRGQYEITDLNNAYIKEGRLGFSFLKGFWSDAGTHESLYHASTLVREKLGKK